MRMTPSWYAIWTRSRHEQVVRGIADDILARLEAMGGLNPPHLSVQDRIMAQAYDISAYKIAADELTAAAKVRVLYHAFGATPPAFARLVLRHRCRAARGSARRP